MTGSDDTMKRFTWLCLGFVIPSLILAFCDMVRASDDRSNWLQDKTQSKGSHPVNTALSPQCALCHCWLPFVLLIAVAMIMMLMRIYVLVMISLPLPCWHQSNQVWYEGDCDAYKYWHLLNNGSFTSLFLCCLFLNHRQTDTEKGWSEMKEGIVRVMQYME